jgi:hypothetical protein
MLSIDPDKRYQTAGELNEALTRCAHRNGLLMSAPELAQELIDTCGDYNQWRGDDDDDDDLAYVPRAGTEVYDASDDDEDEDQGPVSIHSLAAKANRTATPSKSAMAALRPKTEIGKYNGVELTSIINMIDLEGGEGSKPLSTSASAARLGPRLDSGPSASPTSRRGAIPDDRCRDGAAAVPAGGPISSQLRAAYPQAGMPTPMMPPQQSRAPRGREPAGRLRRRRRARSARGW